MYLYQQYCFTWFIFANFYSTLSFNVVFDLPRQLTYNREENIIFTIFETTIGERIDVTIMVKPENISEDRNAFNLESSFFASSTAETRRFRVRTNTSSEVWDSTPDDDVMFNALVNVSVSSSNGAIWKKEQTIPVVKIKGHIFIQTDRPVYQPKDKVFIRFIPVDDQLKPLNQPMDMSILAPNSRPDGLHLLSWTKKKAASKKVFTRSFVLPETPPIGQWIVSAKFFRNDVISKEFYSTFYVGDITLPTFELRIVPVENFFILPDDERFFIEIFARFVYGKPLDAMATVRVGLYNRRWRNPLVNSFVLPPLDVTNGKVSVTVPVANLTVDFNPDTLFRGDTHFFVEASVTERGGGQTRSIRNTDVILTLSPITIALDETSGYFKPGLPFVIKTQASFINGSAAGDFPLVINATGLLRNGRTLQLSDNVISTGQKGKITHSFNVSVNVKRILITVRGQYNSFNGRSYITEQSKVVLRQTSTYDQYIQIVLPNSDYASGMFGAAQIYVTPTSLPKTIVYSIRGGSGYFYHKKSVAAANQRRFFVTFPIVSEMSPISHFTAYFIATTSAVNLPNNVTKMGAINYIPGGQTHRRIQHVSGRQKSIKKRHLLCFVLDSLNSWLPFIITDSASIHVENICHGRELRTSLLNPTEEIFPGQSLTLEVSAHPHSIVGVTGIDSAAASWEKNFDNDDIVKEGTLTRKNLFDVMRSSFPGCELQLKPYQETSFPAIGRILLSNVNHNTEEATSTSCAQEQIAKRKKRSILTSTLKRKSMIEIMKSGKHFLGFDLECCAVGASNVTSVTVDRESCQKRAETVTLGSHCREMFLKCCYFAAGKRSEAGQVAQPALRQSYDVISVFNGEMPLLTSHSVMDQAMQLVRSRFAWTWFNADFVVGETGVELLDDGSRPSIPNLPDSITSWTLEAFSLSADRGVCVMNPLTFSVNHSLFIEVNLPEEKVLRGKKISIEITLFSYLLHVVWANISLSVDENFCVGSNSVIKIQNIPPSSGKVASTELVRFNLIPLVSGNHRVKVKMQAYYQGIERPHSDTVVKTLKVEDEGLQRQEVQWTLLEKERTNRRKSTMSIELAPFVYPIPGDSIPGTEKTILRIHSFASAALREPIIKDGDGSADTIAQYLYTMQFLISKMKTSGRFLNSDDLLSLTNQAQRAYNGLLRYVRDISKNRGDRLCGFSYSPAETAKPDLWLTSATLRIICQLSELIEIVPEERLLVGSLNWILSHQHDVRSKNFFANKPVSVSRPSRRTRDSSKRSTIRSLLINSRRKKNCKKTQARQATASSMKELSSFQGRLDKRVYRTAVIAASLNSILLSVRRSNHQPGSRLRPSSLDAINTVTLKDSLRKALFYIGSNVMENIRCSNSFSPLTLAASARAMFMLSGRRRLSLERKLKLLVRNSNNRQFSWIEHNKIADSQQPRKLQQQKNNSTRIEATAYVLQLKALTGGNGEKFANWLLKQRQSNNRWLTLKDTLASMMALENYVISSGRYTEANSMRVQVLTPGMSDPIVLTPSGTRSFISDMTKLPSTTNTVNMTLVGSGNVWAEFNMVYNLPTTNRYNAVDSDLLCPFDFSISFKQVSLLEFQAIFRSSSSDTVWEVALGVGYKPWYDVTALGDATYVVDFGLHSNYVPITYHLDQLSNPIEKVVDSYRFSKRSLLFYISEERNISFQIKEKRKPEYNHPLPILIYPAANPEQRCRFYYTFPGTPVQLTTFCSSSNTRLSGNDTCVCVTAKSCPRVLSRTKSTKLTTEQRLRLTCKTATKFAYRIRIEGIAQQGPEWQLYHGFVRRIYKLSDDLSGIVINQNYTFWVRQICGVSKILLKKDYLLLGRSAVQTQDGMFKHLLDSHARLEMWPGRRNDCYGLEGKKITVCRKLNDFEYQMRTTGCPSS